MVRRPGNVEASNLGLGANFVDGQSDDADDLDVESERSFPGAMGWTPEDDDDSSDSYTSGEEGLEVTSGWMGHPSPAPSPLSPPQFSLPSDGQPTDPDARTSSSNSSSRPQNLSPPLPQQQHDGTPPPSPPPSSPGLPSTMVNRMCRWGPSHGEIQV